VSLDACAVELPLDARRAKSLDCGGDVLRGLREHRRDRTERRQPVASETRDAFTHRNLCHLGEIARKHRGSADVRNRDARRLRHRVGHDAFERALAKLAEEQTDEQSLLRLRRSGEQRPEFAAARRLRPATGDSLDTSHCRIDLQHLERGRRLSGRRRLAERSPSHSDRPLGELAREVRDRDADLGGRRVRQAERDALDLLEPRGRRGDVSRRVRDLGQEHRLHSTSWVVRSRRLHPSRPRSLRALSRRERPRPQRRSRAPARFPRRRARHQRG
jgi:hypothetical protein